MCLQFYNFFSVQLEHNCKMRLVICDTVDYVAEWSAKYVLKRINDFQPNENKYFVLGLPTGMYYCIYYYLSCITKRKEKEKGGKYLMYVR